MFRKMMKYNTYKMVFENAHQTNYAKIIMKKDVVKFFLHNFDLKENEIRQIFIKFPSFYNYSYASLCDNYVQLMNLGILKEDIVKRVQILTLHPITVKNYAMILEEGGFIKEKINPNTILKFKYMTKMSIAKLKAENYISNDINVQNYMLSFIKFPQELYPTYSDDSLPWNEVQNNVLKLYVTWKIQMDVEDFKRAQIIYHRLSNKSFRLMEKSIDIMLNQLHFTEDKLKKNLYLLHSDPDNTLEILNKFKFLCGMDTKLTLNKHPKIIISSWKTIEQISKHFSEFGVPEAALAKAPEVYTLASSTVYRRLRKIIETPELASFIGNPQIARLVYNQNKVNSRLKYLQSKNCVSLNLLVTSNSLFNRFNCNGNEKGKTNDIMIYLINMFGGDKKKLRAILERHSYWQYISLLPIRQTCEFLINNKFTKDEIYHCIHIILYPIHTVKYALESVQDTKNVSCLRNSSGLIKREYILSLVLYNIERNYHFSGNGVWSSNKETNESIMLDSTNSMFDDTEELDHEIDIYNH